MNALLHCHKLIQQLFYQAILPQLTVRDVPATIRGAADLTKVPVVRPGATMTVADAEKHLVQQALKETNGNRTKAAQKIGMSRRTFHRKLHEYHLEGF